MPRPLGSKNTKPAGVRVNAIVSAEVAQWLKSTGDITGTIKKLCEEKMKNRLLQINAELAEVSKELRAHAKELAALDKIVLDSVDNAEQLEEARARWRAEYEKHSIVCDRKEALEREFAILMK